MRKKGTENRGGCGMWRNTLKYVHTQDNLHKLKPPPKHTHTHIQMKITALNTVNNLPKLNILRLCFGNTDLSFKILHISRAVNASLKFSTTKQK